ncbi:MAG: hypothetical protein V1782_04505, partial [Pseudomonadota bacterium]
MTMVNVEVSGLRGFSRRSARLKGYATSALCSLKRLILPQFCGVGVKPLFYYSTMPAQNEPETYSHSSNASVADCSRL